MSNDQYHQTLAILEKRAEFYKKRVTLYKCLIFVPTIITLLLVIHMATLLYMNLQPASFTIAIPPPRTLGHMIAFGPGALVTIVILDIALVPVLYRRMMKQAFNRDANETDDTDLSTR